MLKHAAKLSINEVNFVFQYGLRSNLSIKAIYAAKSKIIRLFSDFFRASEKTIKSSHGGTPIPSAKL